MADKLRQAAQALIDRWDSPAWGGSAENLRHTGEYIAALRAALDQPALAQQPAVPPEKEPSPTAGMNIAQRILHVGGRNNAAGYVEFGSIQAVQALVRQVLRDIHKPRLIPDHELVTMYDECPRSDSEMLEFAHNVMGAMLNAAPEATAVQQDPVAWMYDWLAHGHDKPVCDWISQDKDEVFDQRNGYFNIRPLYTHSAPAEVREALTIDELAELMPDDHTPMSLGEAFVKFARLVEQAHGIGSKA